MQTTLDRNSPPSRGALVGLQLHQSTMVDERQFQYSEVVAVAAASAAVVVEAVAEAVAVAVSSAVAVEPEKVLGQVVAVSEEVVEVEVAAWQWK